MSEDMGEKELAALEAYVNREPQNAWQRSKLKRRALHALRILGVEVNGRITKLYRSRRTEEGGEGSQ